VLVTFQDFVFLRKFLDRDINQLPGSDSPGSQRVRLRTPAEEEIRATDETRIRRRIAVASEDAAVTLIEIRVSSVFHPWRLSSSAFPDRGVSVEPPTRDGFRCQRSGQSLLGRAECPWVAGGGPRWG
jgi:hypothetical protein